MNFKKLTICFSVIVFLLLQNNSVFAGTKRTFLWITQVNPVNKSINFNVDKSIVIKFNSKILKGSKVSMISLTKEDKKAINHSITLKNNILEIKPKSNLEHKTTYILTIPVNSIKDIKGNSLAVNFKMQFTTKKKDASKYTQIPDQIIDSNSNNSDLVFSELSQTVFDKIEISPNIKSLHFVNCDITSLDLTKGYENLKSIEIKASPITSVDMSHGLDNLTALSIIDSPITSLDLQLSLVNLSTLNIVNSPITDMSNLNSYKNLNKLDLSRSYFSDLDQLSKLTNLTELNLSGNGVDAIDALKGLFNLSTLNLSNNAISDIEALSGLEKLKTLLLSNNDITDYSPVSSFYSNLINPDFTLIPGQSQPQITKVTEPATSGSVTNSVWSTLNNWPYNGKSDGLSLENKAEKSIRMLSSNDMGKTAVVGDKIYLIECDGKVEEYDPATNSWINKSQIELLKGTLRFFKLVTINNKIYIVGANFSEILEYDPKTNQCILKTKLPSKLVVGAVTELNNKIYLFGGYSYDDGSISSSVNEYDPLNDTWVKKKDMPHGTSDLRVASINGKMYTFWIRPSSVVDNNGKTITNLEGFEVFLVDSQDFVEYDPILDSWTVKAQANYLRSDAQLEAIDGKIIVLGEGFEKNAKFPFRKRYGNIEEYNPVSNTWELKSNMTDAMIRWYGTAAYKNEIYIFDNGNVMKYSPFVDKK